MQKFPIPSFTITENPELRSIPEFFKVVGVIESLLQAGTLQKLQGNCVVASELMCSLLEGLGIKSKIVECQLTITKNTDPIELYFIGFDNIGFKGELDTHLVVITETEIPILIDTSIGHYLPADRPAVIEHCTNNSDKNLSLITFESYILNYQFKKTIKLPSLHQKNILQRIQYETNVEKTLRFLKIFIISVALFSVINFTLNWTLIILKMIYP